MNCVIHYNKIIHGMTCKYIENYETHRFFDQAFEITYKNNNIECYPMKNIEYVEFIYSKEGATGT